MLSHYPEISKQPGQTALSSERQGNVIVWYLRKHLTIDQIIDRLSLWGIKATQNDVSSVLNFGLSWRLVVVWYYIYVEWNTYVTIPVILTWIPISITVIGAIMIVMSELNI